MRIQMIRLAVLLVAALVPVSAISQNTGTKKKMKILIEGELQFAKEQYALMNKTITDYSKYPRTSKYDGSLWLCESDWWTSGFYPGSLWYLYEYFKERELKTEAEKRTMPLAKEMYNKDTHDLGFMLFNSFGNGHRLTKNEMYKEILAEGAKSLASRYHPVTGLIKSWDTSEKWQFPVIIDNMMNLELLFWATKTTGDPFFREIAVSHADKTMKHHFRPDYSSFHVVSYDTLTGKMMKQQTHQGFADGSSWARGQGWGLYGYTTVYRETGDKKYLQQANNIAAFILNHKNMPADFIPYWDFDAPAIPNEERDASAAALIASGLLELSNYAEKPLKRQYIAAAEKIIMSLSSPEYRAVLGENNNFILKHSVGAKPFGGEIDVPLVYADYYYIEAMIRYKKFILKEKF